MEALEGACPWEEVQDEAFQAVVGVVAVPLSLGDLHVGVLSHEGHDGPTASETSLDGACHLVGMGEDENVRVRGALPLVCQPRGGHVLRLREASAVGALLGGCQEEGLQEAALEVGRIQEEVCLVEGVQTPAMTPQDWEQRAVGEHLRTAGEGGRLEKAGSGLPGVARPRSHAARPSSLS